jgi:hypothetical protein
LSVQRYVRIEVNKVTRVRHIRTTIDKNHCTCIFEIANTNSQIDYLDFQLQEIIFLISLKFKNIMRDRHYENKFAYFRISNHVVFLDIKDDVVLDDETAIAITTERLKLQQDEIYPVIFNIRAVAGSSKSGRDYLAQHGWILTTRVRIIANQFTSLTVAKFYMVISKPNVKTSIFDNENSAILFLKCNTD